MYVCGLTSSTRSRASITSATFAPDSLRKRRPAPRSNNLSTSMNPRLCRVISYSLPGFPSPTMKLIVGLGNPGSEYEMTRHNLGFMLVDRLFERGAGRRFRNESGAKVADVILARERVLLVKPQTYMNLSGDAVRPLLENYGESNTANLIVSSDDVALSFGTIRVRARGSAGGQKGLKSIIER